MDDNNISNNKAIEKLSEAVKGLLWLSESEYPWQTVYWQDVNHLNCQTVLQHCNYHPETKIITKTIDSFFKLAMKEREWYDEAERAEVKQYRDLYSLLKNNLEDIKVYLVGEVEIDVYVLGKSDDKEIIGLSTKTVET